MKTYPITFQVRGSGEFPFDMLRYDQCWPAKEEDSYRMGYPEYRTVTLKKVTSKDMKATTDDRWKSFCWEVVPGSIQAG